MYSIKEIPSNFQKYKFLKYNISNSILKNFIKILYPDLLNSEISTKEGHIKILLSNQDSNFINFLVN